MAFGRFFSRVGGDEVFQTSAEAGASVRFHETPAVALRIGRDQAITGIFR